MKQCLGIEPDLKDHIQSQLKGRKFTTQATGLNTFNTVEYQIMPNLNCAAVMASLVVTSTSLLTAPALAHQNHGHHHGHHHKNQKQKSYNKGYQRGYNKAYKKAIKKQYKDYNHTPVYYQPIRRPLVVAPIWRAPRPIIVNPNYYQHSRPRINVGYGFSL